MATAVAAVAVATVVALVVATAVTIPVVVVVPSAARAVEWLEVASHGVISRSSSAMVLFDHLYWSSSLEAPRTLHNMTGKTP